MIMHIVLILAVIYCICRINYLMKMMTEKEACFSKFLEKHQQAHEEYFIRAKRNIKILDAIFKEGTEKE